jgi:antitoxin component YwqK of YwqJK toxin-antitoxin module
MYSDPVFRRLVMLALAALLLPAVAGAGRCQFVGAEGGEIEVNTDNGAETAGKTGLLKCYRDGKLWREQELRDGAYIGLDRHYDDDGSISERQVNANGNTHGLRREFYPGGQLKSEASYDDGDVVGVSRSFHRDGKPAAIRFSAARGEPTGSVIEFNAQGQVSELRCGPRSNFPEDREPCGFDGKAHTVELYDRGGRKRGERIHRDGVLLAAKSFNAAGGVAEQSDFTTSGRIDRRYYEHGGLAFEQRIENDYVVAEFEWFMNGQPKRKSEREAVERDARVLNEYYRDNGVLQSREELRGRRRVSEEKFDEAGRLAERLDFDEDSRLARQRKYAADGSVTVDDSFYPDGSRK